MRLLTAKEVAPILQVKPARVYELARERAIPSVRVGERQLRFEESALRDWIVAGGSLQTGNNGSQTAAVNGGSA